eukprot:TRINITY_DN4711_c0_g1_i10.p1 TRINITY_DN4711_c0_g1~~TRINITY_DN4711_c0_g1_i10.p1  ORF type:complete len:336 (+),score=39.82 TRINITY_DN4711_c0_g1_i10:245-1252(+)
MVCWLVGVDSRVYIGTSAQSMRGILALKAPVESGIVANWNDMQELWQHAFQNELQVRTEEHPILITEPPLNPIPNREKTVHMMFEQFNTPATYLAMQPVLSLYASGRTTGIVLDSGQNVTRAVPIHEGHALPHAISGLEIGGRDLTDYLTLILLERGRSFTFAEREIVANMKETLCYVSQDFAEEMKVGAASAVLEKHYELPDASILTISTERFRCPEPLFRPALLASESSKPSVQELVHHSISRCDAALHSALYSNIVLAGGCTMFPGFADRLTKELSQLAPAATEFNVTTPPEPRLSAWTGASLMATSSNQVSWILRSEYEECGPSIVHRRCV